MEHRYILYGAGELGINTLSKLRKKGICVIAFLDKKEKDMIMGVPVLSLRKGDLETVKKDEIVVVICLSDGMLHHEVAEEIYMYGFKKIVFLPLEYQLNSIEKKVLTNRYNRALIGEDVYNEIEDYNIYRKQHWNDDAIIRMEKQYIVAWVGQEILFSEDVNRWKGDISKVNIVNDGIDTNLNSYYWIHELYDYFDGKREDCSKYLAICGLKHGEENAIKKIQSRERLYFSLKKEWGKGNDFFIEAAPEVMWNPKGYFNLVGGHHRTVFLQHQGNVTYPVRIHKTEYRIWENREKLFEIIEFIKQNNIYKTYVPVPHPYFINFPYQREVGNPSIISHILEYLGPIRLEEKGVLDASQYEGYFARLAKRMCAKNVKIYNQNETTAKLIKMLCDLLYVHNIEILTNNEYELKQACENVDIIWSMANTRLLLERGYLKNFSGKLFVEFSIEDIELIKMIKKNTKLRHYITLHREVFQGKLMEIGVMEI